MLILQGLTGPGSVADENTDRCLMLRCVSFIPKKNSIEADISGSAGFRITS